MTWTPTGTLKGATGAPGATVEMQTAGGWVQWRHAGDPSWTNLFALSDISGAGGAQAAAFYAASLGNSVDTTFAIQHNLNTLDVVVNVYHGDGDHHEVDVDVEHTNANVVTLRFQDAPANQEFRVVVLGQAAAGGTPAMRGAGLFTGHGVPSGDPVGSQPGDLYIDLNTGDYYQIG